MPTLLHGPGCNVGDWYGMPPSCALLGGFAIGARVVLLWQHNAKPSYRCERDTLASALVLALCLVIWSCQKFGVSDTHVQNFVGFLTHTTPAVAAPLGRGATTFSKLGGPIPWSRLLYRTKYGWYTQFRAVQSTAT